MSDLQLMPFQEEGVEFLMGRRRAYLADDMGLGKTVQTIVAAERLGLSRVLAVAPASVNDHWRRRWEEWGSRETTLVVLSYANLRKLWQFDGSDWDLVVLDEAHYAKNPKAKRTLAALTLARAAPRAWLLSGTPMPNNPTELWPPIRALWPKIPERLGITSRTAWRKYFTYGRKTQYGWQILGAKNLDQLRPYWDHISLRRTKDTVELPPLRVVPQTLTRDPKFERALAEMGYDPDGLLRSIDAEEDADELGSASRLRRFIGEYKAPLIAKIIDEELRDDQYPKIVVFAYHHSVIDVFRGALAAHNPRGFTGAASQKARTAELDRFIADPSARVFIAQQTAAGTGTDGLQKAAAELVLAEPDWSPKQNKQFIDRIHRMGQDTPCRARVFSFAGSLDEAIMGVIQRKLRMQLQLGL